MLCRGKSLTVLVVTLLSLTVMMPFTIVGAKEQVRTIDTFEEGTRTLELFLDTTGSVLNFTLPADATVKEAHVKVEGTLPPTIENYLVGNDPIAIASADVDGDGDMDLGVTNSKEDSVSILMNDGEGDLGRTGDLEFSVGGSPYDLLLRDLDNDGRVDLATANYGDGSVRVRLTREEMFSKDTSYNVGGSPLFIASGNLDDDNYPDIVVVRKEYPILAVLYNKGDGSFNPHVNIEVSGSPEGFAIEDLDGDKDLDIAVASTDRPYSVLMVMNQGGRTFKEGTPVEVDWPPSGVIAADLNGDDRVDLVVPSIEGKISIINYVGSGFATDKLVLPYEKQKAMFAVDLNSDGRTDLVSMARVDNTIRTFINEGLNIFRLDRLFLMGNNPNDLVLEDLDGDGDPDLATVDLAGNSVSVAFNNGRGRFVWYDVYDTIESDKIVGLGDLDGDGDMDVVLSNYNQQSITMAFNEGNGVFKRVTKYEGYKVYIGGVGGSEPFYTTSADYDGDGDIDVEYGEELSYSVIMMFNNGDGTFTQRSVALVNDTNLLTAPPYITLPVDVDGDKDLDMVANHINHPFISILLNDGKGYFKSKINHSLGDYHPYDIVAEDFDGDGDMDFVTANFGMSLEFENTLTLIRNDGGGKFTNVDNITVKSGPRSLRFADFDLDGKRDIVVAFGPSKGLSDKVPGEVAIIKGKGGGQFDAPAYYRVGILPGRVHVTDINMDEVPDVICLNIGAGTGGSMSVLINKGDGTFNPQLEYPYVTYNHVSFHDFLGDGQDELVLPILSTHIAIYRALYYPGDLAMSDVADGTEAWSQDGLFRTTTDEAPLNLTTVLNDRLKAERDAGNNEGNIIIGLRMSAGKAGIVRLSELKITYRSTKEVEEGPRMGELGWDDPGIIGLIIMFIVLIVVSALIGTPWTPEDADRMLGRKAARAREKDKKSRKGKKAARPKKGKKRKEKLKEREKGKAPPEPKMREPEVEVQVISKAKKRSKGMDEIKRLDEAARLRDKLAKEKK